MYRRTLLGGVAVALAGCATASDDTADNTTTESESDNRTPLDAAAAEAEIRAAINAERYAVNVPDVDRNQELVYAARAHSRDMYERDFYAHRNPDGEEPWDRVTCNASENIHRGEVGEMQNVDSEHTWDTRDPEELGGYVIEGWILSKDHYDNLTDPQWERVGVGVHVAEGEFWVTAMFC
jgi:uncharacterized protein YkwD